VGNPRSRALRSIDGGARRRYPTWEHHFGAHVDWRWCYSRGNPIYGSPRSNDGDAQRRSPCRGHPFWSSHWMVVVLRGSIVSPPASTTVGFGNVVPWKLDGGCMLCCVRRGRNRLTPWWRRWQAWWEASLRSNTLEVGSWRERWRWQLELVHKALSLDYSGSRR
jgi:hypothetical protein